MEEVEDEVHELALTAGRECVLERLEAGRAVRQEYRDFAIQDCLSRGEADRGLRDSREPRCPIPLVAAPERGVAPVDSTEDAVAVELHLVEPLVPLGRGVDEGSQLELDESRQAGWAAARDRGARRPVGVAAPPRPRAPAVMALGLRATARFECRVGL